MCNVMDQATEEQLVEQFRQVVAQLPENLQDCEQAEQMLREGLQQLGRNVLQAWSACASTKGQLPRCPQCGKPMRHRGRVRCSVQTSFGSIRVYRPRRRCDRCAVEMYPHDRYLRFAQHAVSWPLAKSICRLMAWMPAERVMQLLQADYGVHLSKETVQQVAYTAGKMLLEQEDRRRQMYSGLSPQQRARSGPRQGEAGGHLAVVYADGTMVHSEGAWREIRVGKVCIHDKEGKLLRQRSFARFLTVETFAEQLAVAAYQSGYAQAQVRAVVGDGAHWLWSMAAVQFPDAVQVLDWYHLSEHVYQCAYALYGQESQQAKQWVEEQLEQLWRGEHQQVRQQLIALRKQCRAADKREALRELIVYLGNNASRLDYPSYRRLGIPTGSGAVESACKSLVGSRCKLSGMRNWHRANAEAVLALRASLYDGVFDHHWSTHLGQSP